jgi:hypothetical protein
MAIIGQGLRRRASARPGALGRAPSAAALRAGGARTAGDEGATAGARLRSSALAADRASTGGASDGDGAVGAGFAGSIDSVGAAGEEPPRLGRRAAAGGTRGRAAGGVAALGAAGGAATLGVAAVETGRGGGAGRGGGGLAPVVGAAADGFGPGGVAVGVGVGFARGTDAFVRETDEGAVAGVLGLAAAAAGGVDCPPNSASRRAIARSSAASSPAMSLSGIGGWIERNWPISALRARS